MSKLPVIGIVAPSSKVPEVEFNLGLEKIRGAGFEVEVHPQVKKHFRFWAGTDEERASAFYEFAEDSRFSVLWCARGGYGAARLLPHLERMTAKRGIPAQKLLMGYSDATVLMEYVRSRWGWETLHSPMPGMRKFCLQTPREWNGLVSWLAGKSPKNPWGAKPLKWVTAAPKKSVLAPLVGGNLSVWVSLVGTPYEAVVVGKILFLEDVDESVYRVDRMVNQLEQSGGFQGVRAIVLGNFQNCNDGVGKVLARRPPRNSLVRVLREPKASELEPLREPMDGMKTILEIFREVGERNKIPVAYGLPVGHGPGVASLPLGAKYTLSADGRLILRSWGWCS